MNQRSPSKTSHASEIWEHCTPVVWVVCIGVSFSLVLLFAMRWWDRQNVEKAFRLAAKDRTTAVKSAFETELAMLELIRTSLISDGKVERQEFSDILVPFRSRSRSIEAVEWLLRVPDSHRQECEATARREGIEGFRITELGKNGRLVDARRRDEYYPILFIGPTVKDKAVYGYDVASEPIRLESLQLARDTGDTVASGQFAFIQDKNGSIGFLVCLPVYRIDKPHETVANRRANILGFLVGIFRPADMIGAALEKLQPQGIDISLYDSSAAAIDTPFYVHVSRTRENGDNYVKQNRLLDAMALKYSTQLGVSGHPWTIVCVPTPEFYAEHKTAWPWVVFAAGLFVTAMLTIYMLSSIGHTVNLEDKVREQTADLRRAQEEVIWRVVSASRWSDDESDMHMRRVGLFSEVVALAAGWFGEEADAIRQAAPLHDLGKVGIPDEILRKPGKLTPEEFKVMKTHTLIGSDILANSKMPMLQMAQQIALYHHERWNGRGYPHGLAGEEIPECARIVAIVDAYDALTHARVYRPAMSEEEAVAILREGAGTHFDARLLAHFLRRLPEIRAIAAKYPDSDRKPVPTEVPSPPENQAWPPIQFSPVPGIFPQEQPQ